MSGFRTQQIKLQVGQQATKGTAVPATRRLSLLTKRSFKPNAEKLILSSLGSLDPVKQVVPISLLPSGSIEGSVTPRQMVYFLTSMLGEPTPVAAGANFKWTFQNPGEDFNYSYLTQEFVDGLSGGINYILKDCIYTMLELKGQPDKVTNFKADFMALGLETGTATALTEDDSLAVNPLKTKLYIDNFGVAPFTTLYTQGGVEFTLKYDSKAEAVKYIGAEDIEFQLPESELTFKMKWGSVAKSIFDTEITTFLTKKVIGFSLVDEVSGHGIKVTFCGMVKEIPEVPSDEKGVTVAEYVFSPVTDPALGYWMNIEVITDISAL
ncbi:MAG: hypothetical protein KGZ97_09685 [Bacteroidetes bacterium]|nr:hypothetical protein [Bacteroidota bacterium]